MKIALLSRNPRLYSTRRLAQAARSRGHPLTIIDTLHVPVQVGTGSKSSPIQPLPNVDAIIPRIGTSITFYGLAVVRQFEAKGVITTATSEAIARSRDKLHSLQIMNSNGLPIPNTTVVSDPEDALQAIQTAGGLPVILKLIRGTQGRGVFLAREMHTVTSVLRTVHRASEQMLVQEYIKESSGSDIRVIVVGNRCVAAMQRTASHGDFRSNLHRGGTASPSGTGREHPPAGCPGGPSPRSGRGRGRHASFGPGTAPAGGELIAGIGGYRNDHRRGRRRRDCALPGARGTAGQAPPQATAPSAPLTGAAADRRRR